MKGYLYQGNFIDNLRMYMRNIYINKKNHKNSRGTYFSIYIIILNIYNNFYTKMSCVIYLLLYLLFRAIMRDKKFERYDIHPVLYYIRFY